MAIRLSEAYQSDFGLEVPDSDALPPGAVTTHRANCDAMALGWDRLMAASGVKRLIFVFGVTSEFPIAADR